ncbi:hypothetical protein D9615_005322 [Tricholomella constricta]|uniref:Uncharacterized protein n=1 Tax=Tricholomella constricta TaxID=117010 RepID=A0A8H5M155_9AGAR|nr:hypothetical protein D9615_005322 [Tricholomella constricta]
MSDDSKTLRYNVRWIENTFTSRTTTQSLLAPERDAGNISSHDYDAATHFLPAFHRHYRYVGGLLGIPLMYAVRRPNWSNTRTYLFLTTASFGGFLIGHVMSLSAHYNFVRSIENPEGFSQALDNIQKNTGSFPLPGPIIVRQGGKWAVDHDPDTPPIHTPPMTRDTTAPSPTTDTAPASIKSTSKWDQIRAVNSRTSTNSSWDALRQNHERARVPASPTSMNEGFERTRAEDRAAEQAKFDELLEKERNMK